ncbi:hypothetical protein EC991_010383 [Linnemannia zychae]|nr:hypothetical protein EC991_010383 [Linnemannia zychae]
MTVDDSEMQRLWKLTNELTAQLVFNRSATLELKQQLAELQAQTTSASLAPASGYGPSSSTRESQDYALRIANERLREENLQLQEQVNEYERWMEYIMTKFRLQNLAMAQTRKESMQEASKMAEQGSEAAYRLQEENTVLQARLADLGSVARKAIHEEYYTTESLIESLETENRSLREMLGVAEGGRGPVSGRLGFFVGNHGLQDGDEEDDYEGLRNRASRVSFPSTAGSVVASSESDREQQLQEPYQQSQPQHQYATLTRRSASDGGVGTSAGIGFGRQPLSPTTPMRNSGSGLAPLTVHTGLRSPTATATSTAASSSSLSSPGTSTPSRSVSGLSSATSPTSPSWSSSTSASSSALASPTFQQDPSRRMVSISPPLDPPPQLDDVAGAALVGTREQSILGATPVSVTVGQGQQQKSQRGKMTINTKLGGHSAGRSL